MLFILLYDHVGLVSNFIDAEQASMVPKEIRQQKMSPADALGKLNVQQSEMDSK